MPGIYSAQETTVTFDGVLIGYVTGWDWAAESSSTVETTSVSSPVVGTGANARVRKQYDVTGIEPPTFSVTFYGPPSFSMDDAGKKATLEFSGGDAVWTGTAILRRFSHAGRVNKWTDGGAEFQATGE